MFAVLIFQGCGFFGGSRDEGYPVAVFGREELSGLVDIALQEGREEYLDADLAKILEVPQKKGRIKIQYLISGDKNREFFIIKKENEKVLLIMIHHKTKWGEDLEGYFYLIKADGGLKSAVHAKRGSEAFSFPKKITKTPINPKANPVIVVL